MISHDVAVNECVCYRKDSFDSHAAFDKKSNRYTIVVSGEYIFSPDNKNFFKSFFIAGSKIQGMIYIARDTCRLKDII